MRAAGLRQLKQAKRFFELHPELGILAAESCYFAASAAPFSELNVRRFRGDVMTRFAP